MTGLDDEKLMRLVRESTRRYQGPRDGNLLDYLQTAFPFAEAVQLKSELLSAYEATITAHVALSQAREHAGVEAPWRGY